MAYIFPHDPFYDEIVECGRTPNAREIICQGLIWQRRKDKNGPYFASIGNEPEYDHLQVNIPASIRDAYNATYEK